MKLSAPTPDHTVQQSAQQPVQKRSFQMRRRSSVVEVLDRFFFVFAGIATLWLGAILFMAGWGLNFEYWVYFVVFWVVVAYLGLPRLHRILSYIYVPDYFIGRTRTSDGILGDPVNIGVRGSEAQLHAAMQAAGWTRADDITARSIWRIIISTVRRRSYLHAPVSPLFLFGRQQDFAYQQEVGGNPKQRHHVRFWHCPKGWLLPGGYRVDWLAAGSYDKSVGLSLFTFQITHKVDENIDIERDYITSSVLDHNVQARVAVLKDFSTGYHSRNGGGDTIITDGDLPILELAQVPVDSSVQLTTPPRAGLIFDSTKPVPLLPVNHELTPTAELGQAIWSRRPLQLLAGAMLVAVSVIMELVQFVQDMYDAWQTGSAGQVAGSDCCHYQLGSDFNRGRACILCAAGECAGSPGAIGCSQLCDYSGRGRVLPVPAADFVWQFPGDNFAPYWYTTGTIKRCCPPFCVPAGACAAATIRIEINHGAPEL